ncbi:CHAD domain protein [Thalassovita gelatinovora]|uniref:CHAD domain protein n=1 Tax=Thalassovita gelatinovora TaxID=53501 RepID=A0A0P1FGZ9_THAGE|nr:CHAD domain-containing protein [Thalassovita gelatinovora]QIZ81919.1 CHAD domain-containing protein [Thalassovita gelatinovora]CUH67289.1 CHAD domain protein [Thalassovita gelatinovora]SEP76935.1 CHAD domain-containing protein [Thalassovita gelatinovora]
MMKNARKIDANTMTYRLTRKDKTLQSSLRRIALEQIDAGLLDMGDPALDRKQLVHNLRKRCKKLRGLIWLVHHGFAAARDEDCAIRDLARLLADSRDRSVLLDTHSSLGGDAVSSQELPLPEGVEDGFRALRDRAAGWTLKGKDAAILTIGLTEVAERMNAAFEQAMNKNSAENLHHWRTWAKYHWYHARLMQSAWPGPIRARRFEAQVLAEALGDHHDLAVYRDRLAQGPNGAPDKLEAKARKRQRALERQAYDLGRRFKADKPGDLAKRWVKWWKISRAG